METLEIALDENGNKVVVLPDIIFSNKTSMPRFTWHQP